MNDLEGRIADEFSVLNSSLTFPNGEGFYLDEQDGVSGYNTDPQRGADTFHPFQSIEFPLIVDAYSGGSGSNQSYWKNLEPGNYTLIVNSYNASDTPTSIIYKNGTKVQSSVSGVGSWGGCSYTTDITSTDTLGYQIGGKVGAYKLVRNS